MRRKEKMKYLDCTACTAAEYVSEPVCPNCGEIAYWADGVDEEVVA